MSIQDSHKATVNKVQNKKKKWPKRVVFGADKTAHNHALQQCFARLEENGLIINRKKYEFYKDKLDFYGLTFFGEGISPNNKKVEAF